MLRLRVKMAEEKGLDYVPSTMLFGEVAVCIKTEHIEDMVKFGDDKNSDTDRCINMWLADRKKQVRFTIPSLIDHRDTESIYRENYKLPPMTVKRKAPNFYE